MKPLSLLMAALALIAAGCATTKQAIQQPLPSLFVNQAQRVHTTRGLTTVEITVPAGEYRAKFRDADGIYYRPDADIVMWGKPVPDSYLFVADDKAKPPGLWIEGSLKADPLVPAVAISSTTK